MEGQGLNLSVCNAFSFLFFFFFFFLWGGSIFLFKSSGKKFVYVCLFSKQVKVKSNFRFDY